MDYAARESHSPPPLDRVALPDDSSAARCGASTCPIAGQEVYIFELCLCPPPSPTTEDHWPVPCAPHSLTFPMAQRLLPAGLCTPNPHTCPWSAISPGFVPISWTELYRSALIIYYHCRCKPPPLPYPNPPPAPSEPPSVLATTRLGLPCQSFLGFGPVWSLLCPPPHLCFPSPVLWAGI